MPTESRLFADLAPNPNNPRTITKPKAEMLAKSLRQFGDLGGIVFNRRSGHVVGGHQRISCMSELKDSRITMDRVLDKPSSTGTVAEGFIEIEGDRFAYREVDWDVKREKAANLAANKGAGEWDMPSVAEWMADLDVGGFDLDLTMFDATERAKLTLPSEFLPSEEEPPRLDEIKTKACPSCGYEL